MGDAAESKPMIQGLPSKLPREQYGRYEIVMEIATGGMATVYLCRLVSTGGFKRLSALKVMHPHLAEQSEFVSMLMDEARIASKIHHPNVVGTLDMGSQDGMYYLVLEYVEGFSLAQLLQRNPDKRPPELIVPVVVDALRGLHVVHTLTGDDGEYLGLVHRDVSPGNILIGVDGISRITDFGIAIARDRITHTTPGLLKGKAGFMAPEQILGKDLDARVDVFAMGVVLWNALTGAKLFGTKNVAATLHSLTSSEIPKPSEVGLKPDPVFDDVIMKALERNPKDRHENANEMALELQRALQRYGRIPEKDVGVWLQEAFGEELAERRRIIRSGSSNPGRSSSSNMAAMGSQSGIRAANQPETWEEAVSFTTEDDEEIEVADLAVSPAPPVPGATASPTPETWAQLTAHLMEARKKRVLVGATAIIVILGVIAAVSQLNRETPKVATESIDTKVKQVSSQVRSYPTTPVQALHPAASPQTAAPAEATSVPAQNEVPSQVPIEQEGSVSSRGHTVDHDEAHSRWSSRRSSKKSSGSKEDLYLPAEPPSVVTAPAAPEAVAPAARPIEPDVHEELEANPYLRRQ